MVVPSGLCLPGFGVVAAVGRYLRLRKLRLSDAAWCGYLFLISVRFVSFFRLAEKKKGQQLAHIEENV